MSVTAAHLTPAPLAQHCRPAARAGFARRLAVLREIVLRRREDLRAT